MDEERWHGLRRDLHSDPHPLGGKGAVVSVSYEGAPVRVIGLTVVQGEGYGESASLEPHQARIVADWLLEAADGCDPRGAEA